MGPNTNPCRERTPWRRTQLERIERKVRKVLPGIRYYLASPLFVEAKDIEAIYDCQRGEWITDAEGVAASWAKHGLVTG